MFCPKCGTENEKGKAYCTRCGESLSGNSPQHHLLVMNIFSGLGTLVALACAAVIYSTQFGHGPVHWAIILAGTFSIMLFCWQLTCFILGMHLARRLKRVREERGAGVRPVGGATTERSLPDAARAEAQFDEARAVTEHTTELLEAAARRGGREGGR